MIKHSSWELLWESRTPLSKGEKKRMREMRNLSELLKALFVLTEKENFLRWIVVS